MNTTQNSDILREIEAFLEKTGMSASYFGKLSTGNSELVGRLRRGGDIRTKTVLKVSEFISNNPPIGGDLDE